MKLYFWRENVRGLPYSITRRHMINQICLYEVGKNKVFLYDTYHLYMKLMTYTRYWGTAQRKQNTCNTLYIINNQSCISLENLILKLLTVLFALALSVGMFSFV